MIGMPPALARNVTRKIRDEYHPASVLAIKGLKRQTLKGCGCGLGCDGAGLGALGLSQSQNITVVSTAAKAGGAIAGAETGAAAGTAAFPVVGTVVGAVVGAAIAILVHDLGNHDVRVNPADMNMCAGFLQSYLQAANQAQGAPIGVQMGIDNLEKLNWCLAALYGKPVNNVDYRFFPIGWQQTTGFVQSLVSQAFKVTPGSIITIPAITGYTTDHKHSNTRPATQVHVPNPLTLQGLAALVTPYMIASCSDGNKMAANCPAFWNNAYAQRMLYDLTAYWVNKLYPQVFAAPKVAVTPATVAKAATVATAATLAARGVSPAITPSKVTPTAATTAAVAAAVASGNASSLPPAAQAMYAQMAADGVNMQTPQAQQILADVATEGVTTTPAGPAPMEAGFGMVGGVLLALVAGGMLLSGGKGKHKSGGGGASAAHARLGF
jgi:hypothetical protein